MLLPFHGSWMINHTHIFHSLSIVGLTNLSFSAQLQDFMPQEKVNLAFLIPLPLEFIILVYEVDVHNLKNPMNLPQHHAEQSAIMTGCSDLIHCFHEQSYNELCLFT